MMAPNVNLEYKGFSFFFHSNEEKRPHVHVAKGSSGKGSSAKFWITRDGVELASNEARLSDVEVRRLVKFLSANRDFVLARWTEFFSM